AASCALLLSGCFSPGDGVPPPLDQIYFPTGVALDDLGPDGAPLHLFVASSDFDLQYRASALQSYDLEKFRHLEEKNATGAPGDEAVPRPCNDDSHCPAGMLCDVDSRSGTR